MMKKYSLLLFLLIWTAFAAAQVDSDSSDPVPVMNNFTLSAAVTMYPNPVENYLTIRSSAPITRVMVFSLLGDQVKDIQANFLRIDLRDLNSGIYMIKIYSNQLSVTKKLIKM